MLAKANKIYEHFDVQKFPTIIVLAQKDGEQTEMTYNGELDYASLEKYLLKNAVPKKPATPPPKVKVEEAKPQASQEPPKPVIKELTPDNLEETVYGTEGLVLVHVFKGNEPHKTFNEVSTKFK